MTDFDSIDVQVANFPILVTNIYIFRDIQHQIFRIYIPYIQPLPIPSIL
jgi:hypothetical protein